MLGLIPNAGQPAACVDLPTPPPPPTPCDPNPCNARPRPRPFSPPHSIEGASRIKFRIATRGLLGLRNAMLTATRGMGVMNTIFLE